MRQFNFQRNSDNNRRDARPTSPGTVMETAIDYAKQMRVDGIFDKVLGFLHDAKAAVNYSLDNRHPEMEHLASACDNFSAMLECIPVLTSGNIAGAVLQNPKIIALYPRINFANGWRDFQILKTAFSYYVGSSEADKSPEHKTQTFMFFANMLTPSDDTQAVERSAKDFVRKVNQVLINSISDGDPETKE